MPRDYVLTLIQCHISKVESTAQPLPKFDLKFDQIHAVVSQEILKYELCVM